MKTLRETVAEARKKGVAVGHFNISNLEALNAIFAVAKKLGVPVIIGVSEGERDFAGVGEVVDLVRGLRTKHNFPIYLNADHTYSFERVKEAIDAGFDSVIFDGAKLSFEENIKLTKQCVDYAKKSGKDVLVEAELGYIGQSSKVLDKIPDGVKLDRSAYTSPAQAKEFVEKTGVDMFAPAVGNIHGMFKGGDPALDIDLIEQISKTVHVPLVLHGASGNSDDDIKQAIKAGISVIHINTEIRVAYRDGLKKSLEENPEEVAPYKFLKEGEQAIERVVEAKLKLFNNL